MKFRMYRVGEKAKLGLVEATTHLNAQGAAAEKWGGYTEDYRAESVRERIDVKCGDCGHPMKMDKHDVESDYMKRCTVCRANFDMEHKALIFLKAQEKYEALLARRAKVDGITVDAARKLVEKR